MNKLELKNFQSIKEKVLQKEGHTYVLKRVNYLEFKKVITVFQQPPFYEKCTEADMKTEFQGYENNGFVMGCYIDGEIKGINCVLKEVEEEHKDIIKFPNDDKVAYISGIATLKEARGHGVGTLLMEHTIEHLKQLQTIDYLYLRTNLYNSMSEGIAYKHGFYDYQLGGEIVVQNVEFERNDPTISSVDERKLMVKKLNAIK